MGNPNIQATTRKREKTMKERESMTFEEFKTMLEQLRDYDLPEPTKGSYTDGYVKGRNRTFQTALDLAALVEVKS